jgi:hypothetical protein
MSPTTTLGIATVTAAALATLAHIAASLAQAATHLANALPG